MKNDIDKKTQNGGYQSKINLDIIKMFKDSPDFIYIHDVYGNIIEINKNMQKILGLRKQETKLENLSNNIICLDDDKIKASDNSKFFKKLTKKTSSLEYKIKSNKGKMVDLEGYSVPIENNGPNSLLFLHIAHDISKKKKIQEDLSNTQRELKKISTMVPEVRLWSLSQKKNSINLIKKSGQVIREGEEKYRTILDNIQEGYFEIDLNGNFVFFNNALCKIVGYSSAELNGLHYRKLIDGKTASLIKFSLENTLPRNYIQLQIIKRNKKRIHAESSLSEKYNLNGEKIGLFGILRDIAEKKKAEELESKFRDELENKVKTRTRELHEALESQRLYMNEILKASNFKTAFLSTMSHELRTPLNAIIGFSDILIEESYGTLISDQKEFLNDIKSSAEHLLEMINKILDLSKIEAGELELKLSQINLKMIIDQTLSIIKPIYAKKNIEFELIGIKEDSEIIADLMRLKEILFNLLSNAIKFTPKGKVSLELSENKREWIINIIDTGIGIEEKDFDIIFKEFKRVESKFVSSIQGSGLGLALTKKLIELHEGRIFFKSKYGKGSTFTFTIPKNLKITS